MTAGPREDFSWLPALLAEVAEVAGVEAAIRLARARGGTEVHIPARAPDGHWLVETVGREAADLICDHFRAGNKGQTLMLPLGPTGTLVRLRRLADRMIRAGEPISKIARATGYTSRAIEMRKAKLKVRAHPDQHELFQD